MPSQGREHTSIVSEGGNRRREEDDHRRAGDEIFVNDKEQLLVRNKMVTYIHIESSIHIISVIYQNKRVP
jgi:hypothetical protein